MPLTTPFTDTEKEYVREIVGVPTSELSAISDKLDALNDAGAEATRNDIAAWKKIRYGTVGVYGGLKGTDHSTDRDRQHITNRVRLRLNMSEVRGSLGRNEMGLVRFSVGGWWDSAACDE